MQTSERKWCRNMSDRKKLKVCWISAGVSSFIAGYLAGDVDEFIYIDVSDQHEDSLRFIKDCEKALGKKITVIRSEEYHSVDEAIRAAGIIKNPYNQFAPCTVFLKKRVRRLWEQQHAEYDITYVWGFDFNEKDRAERMKENEPEFEHEFPLIEKELSKQDVHGMADKLGIKRPVLYDMGYNNNNCIGCVKGGMGYWNQIRKDFPDIFESRAKMERAIGAAILKDSTTGEPVYLDELEPNRGRMQEEIMPDCSIMCYLAGVNYD